MEPSLETPKQRPDDYPPSDATRRRDAALRAALSTHMRAGPSSRRNSFWAPCCCKCCTASGRNDYW